MYKELIPMKKRRNDSDTLLLTGSMKLADLLDLNYNLLGVLSRVGLRFGFGDDTVDEACRKHGINAQTFLLICKVYTFAGYMPSSEVLRTADLRDIVTYLRSSHSYYMDTATRKKWCSRMCKVCSSTWRTRTLPSSSTRRTTPTSRKNSAT